MEEHHRNVALLQKTLAEKKLVSIAKGAGSSNTTRDNAYKKKTVDLDLRKLNRVLLIDEKQKIAVVEPRVSMWELVGATLKFGLMPKVVPEFKGITVGGAIMGCGGESSSHRYGLFHDTALSYELLLGNGECITVSPTEHEELFHALHGSYGSLGIILSVTIPLIDAKPYVNLTYSHFSDPHAAISYIRSRPYVDFVEGVIFSKDCTYVITGALSDHPEHSILSLSKPSSPWYYQQRENTTLSLTDYLFRYDKGAFWMGTFVLRPGFLLRFLTGLPIDQEKYAALEHPSRWKRMITSKFVDSQTLYSLLHKSEKWIETHLIIQDFTIPESRVSSYLEKLTDTCPLYPLWLCPARSAKSSQLFSPTACSTTDPLHINIGVYGVPNSQSKAITLLSELEKSLTRCGGRKWLYTNSTYSPDDFWNIYSKTAYQKLRNEYQAHETLLSIEEKVLQK